MRRTRPFLLCLLLGPLSAAALVTTGGGCSKQEPALGPVGTPASPRRVELSVSNQGFKPARIRGRPGESVTLVVRYDKSAGECGREVVLPAQKIRVALSEQQPTEIALTLPRDKGEVGFTCGMDMLRGAIVVE
jgi:plastocyanin domain-containing protein